jgi:glycosyltransferase involved in cell wall biosynthesis
MLRVAALVPHHLDYCGGQRFRIETWARHLAPRGIDVSFLPFSDRGLTNVLYRNGHYARKSVEMLRCYAHQVRRVLSHPRPDVVFIYREASLLGPAVIETLSRRWRAPIVYDLDEPLFVPLESPSNGLLSMLRFPSKVPVLMGLSERVLVVNRITQLFASTYAKNVEVVPMAADTDRYTPAPHKDHPRICVGWVGSRTTQKNLQAIAEPLARLCRTHGAKLRVIGDVPMSLGGVELEFFPWRFDTEVPQLHECQIGVVPVQPDNWSPWKFYFKLVQLMSLGLPVVAAPVGANLEIIEDGVNGFLATSPENWYERLRLLAENSMLRRTMGEAARATVEKRFSLRQQVNQLEGILLESVQRGSSDRAAAE